MIPDRLFHITTSDRAELIRVEGFKAIFGNYFCSDPNICARFVFFQALMNPDAEWTVVEIDPTGLEVHLSMDHDPEFFSTTDSWWIPGEVPATAIVDVRPVILNGVSL